VLDGRRFRLTYKPRELKPVTDALKIQGRFRHLSEDELNTIQEKTIDEWERLLKLDGKELI